jgi:hypothetical protein
MSLEQEPQEIETPEIEEAPELDAKQEAELKLPEVAEEELSDPAPVNPVRQMREALKKKEATIKEAHAENARMRQLLEKLEGKAPDQSAKPTLEDVGFDEDKYAEKIIQWNEGQRNANKAKEAQKTAEEDTQKEWIARATQYQAEISKLGDEGIDAQSIVETYTTPSQQSIIVMGAQNPAQFVADISKHDALLEQMAAIQNPVKLAAFIARTEMTLKKSTQNKPAPEQGFQKTTVAAPKNLDALRDECLKSGDMTKYYAQKRLSSAKK